MKVLRYIITGLLILNLSGTLFAFESCPCGGYKSVSTCLQGNSYTYRDGHQFCMTEDQENTCCRDNNSMIPVDNRSIVIKYGSGEERCKPVCLLFDDTYFNEKSQKITIPKTENIFNIYLINEITIYAIDSYLKLGLFSDYSTPFTLRIYLQTSALLI